MELTLTVLVTHTHSNHSFSLPLLTQLGFQCEPPNLSCSLGTDSCVFPAGAAVGHYGGLCTSGRSMNCLELGVHLGLGLCCPEKVIDAVNGPFSLPTSSSLFPFFQGKCRFLTTFFFRKAANPRRLWGVVTIPEYLAAVNSLPQFESDLYKWHQEKTLCLYCNIRRAINAKLHWKTGLQWRHNFRQPCNFLFMLVPDKRQYVIVPGMDNRGKRGKYNSFI